MLSIAHRYMARRISGGIFVALLIVTGVIMLIDFVEGTRNLGQDLNINNFQIMQLTLLKVPSLIEETIPFVVLFGVMGALYNLNRRSELVVLRATGLSAWNFLSPAVAVTFTLGLIWATLFNPIASHSLSIYKAKISAADSSPTENKDIWLRDVTEKKKTLVRASSYDPETRKLSGVTMMQSEADPNGEFIFRTRFDANTAELLSSGYWQLYEARENTDDIMSGVTYHDTISIPTQIQLDDINSQSKTDYVAPFWQLPDEITRTRRAGFATTGLEMKWQKLLSLPLTLVAMAFIAAGVSMHLTREGGTLRLLITGVCIGFGVYFTNSIFNAFGESATLPILISAWTVPIMTFFLGVTYVAKIEDG